MKAYTDLEQSKKLAEILPLESADMCYPLPCEDGDKPLLEQGGFGSTPCWSLAALLGVLKDGALDFANSRFRVYSNGVAKYMDNPVDACYEMIIRSNELKML